MLYINIRKKFNDELLFSAQLELGKKIYFLEGENGTGKTTFLNILSKQDLEYKGEILFNNTDIRDINEDDYKNYYINYLNQEIKLFEKLTCKENFEILIGDFDSELLNNYLEKLFFNKIFYGNVKVKKLSGGEKQKLNIIINLCRRANIYLVDEIDNNLDKDTIKNLIVLLKELDTTIILVSHNYEYFKEIIDNKIIIENNVFVVNSGESYSSSKKFNLKKYNNKVILSKKDLKNIQRKYNTGKYIYILPIFFLALFLSLCISNITAFVNNGFVREDLYSPTSSILSPPHYTTMYTFMGDDSWLSDTPYNFNDEDLNYIKSLDYVKEVVSIPKLSGWALSSSLYKDDNNYSNSTIIDYNNLDYVKYGMENYKRDEEVDIELTNLIYPYDFFKNTPYDSTRILLVEDILYGDFPSDGTDEILIDIYMAMYIATEYNVDNLENLIGKEFEFSLENSETKEKEKFNFKISGIYTPSNDFPISTVYFAYDENAEIVQRNNCSLYNLENKEEKDLFDICMQVDGERGSGTKITDEDIETIGVYPAFYIEVEEEADNQKLYEDMKKYDPYIDVDNNYTRENSSSSFYVKKAIQRQVKILIILLITYLFVILIINILMNMKNKKVRNVLYNYGFKRNSFIKYKKLTINKLIVPSLILLIIWGLFIISIGYFIIGIIPGIISIIFYIFLTILTILILQFLKGR